MSRKLLWLITAVLLAGAFAIWFMVMPSRKTELQREGKRAYGTIQGKDSRPIADGSTVYAVTFIFQDAQDRNHQVTVQMFDKGRWDSLNANQEIKDVYYIPGKESEASLPGAERMVTPNSAALSFLAWSLFLVGLVTGGTALFAPRPEPKTQPQTKVTMPRR